MASESPISKLAALPLKNQVAVLVGTMVLLFGGYHQLYYSSMGEELANAESQYSRHEKQSSDLKQKEVEWKQMIQDKEALDLKLSTNQISLPRTSDLASFIGHLQRQAAVSGVTFKNWSRKPEAPVANYVKVPVAIEVVGTFHQILKYFYLLGKTKRIITIEDFALTPLPDNTDTVLLMATFQATTFRQADGAPPPPSKAAPKSGMIDKAKDARAQKEGQVEAVTGGKTDEQGNPVAPKSGVDRLKGPGAK
jgi:type IV pilus assembly protein PilO